MEDKQMPLEEAILCWLYNFFTIIFVGFILVVASIVSVSKLSYILL
jgi:hypothetical protein